MDRQGGAVACVFTANNLFGTGRVAAGTGILLAAAPGAGVPSPPLAALMIHGPGGRGLRAVATGSGQAAAPEAAALPLAAFTRGVTAGDAVSVAPEPARSLLLGCRGPVVNAANSCAAHADPRGSGLGLLVGVP
jgi:gamma-glutamyltranspeptidase/glutathione hydrolase